jgi:phosphoribosylamine--glycine ligase
MNVLIIGSGGREHALALKISQSNKLDKLFTSPGNPGTAQLGNNVNLDIKDHTAISTFITDQKIDCLVIGPEAPLVDGLTNSINSLNPSVIVVGPTKEGAELEGSKAYAKDFMAKHSVPTAGYFECNTNNLNEGFSYLEKMTPPYVLKADGLAAGKGVLIIDNIEEARDELTAMLSGKFGDASSTVVIEEFLDGIEFSVFALTDGKDYKILPIAKDYKRIGEGDTGLNTGGMGAVSPVPFVSDSLMKQVLDNIVEPTINGLNKDNINYKGFVFFGLINVQGQVKVIEYNCRLGDPETEAILPRFESDILEAFTAMDNGNLNQYSVKIDSKSAATIILVSGGYPKSYKKGIKIDDLPNHNSGIIYHAGTKLENDKLVTNGGRVLAITSIDDDFQKALQKSKQIADEINFEGKYFRKDIGFDL